MSHLYNTEEGKGEHGVPSRIHCLHYSALLSPSLSFSQNLLRGLWLVAISTQHLTRTGSFIKLKSLTLKLV